MQKIPVSGGQASGTTFIELDDVKVPVENILGEEGQGMKYIMVCISIAGWLDTECAKLTI
jgi:acyl-CoA dehydrogenase